MREPDQDGHGWTLLIPLVTFEGLVNKGGAAARPLSFNGPRRSFGTRQGASGFRSAKPEITRRLTISGR